jgi:hypothetical protein
MVDKNFDNGNLDDIRGRLGDEDDWFEEDEDDCPFAETLLHLTLLPKPFGIPWKTEQMVKFLKKRGYRIITKFDEEAEEEYYVAVKPHENLIPEDGNIIETFVGEVQEILLKWLEKIAD